MIQSIVAWISQATIVVFPDIVEMFSQDKMSFTEVFLLETSSIDWSQIRLSASVKALRVVMTGHK